MHEQKVRELLQTPPYNSQSDADVAAALNATSNHVNTTPIFITSRTLYKDLGPTTAETILQKLETASATNAVVKRVLAWLLPSEAGIDVTHENTRSQIDGLVSAGVLTSQEGSSIKSLGEVTLSLGQTLGALGDGETINASQVASLR